ncbi:MAG TPA: carboxypeptidase regulatory-like domain-containing protein [Myxococcales bacterium]|jgi:plastocyanin|nr:carboxypeptidase regulatory-like domain-containing protein [Myxococcales bacterium]
MTSSRVAALLMLALSAAAAAEPLTGRVTVSGSPVPRVVQVNVDKKFCGIERAAAELEVSATGGLANAVVSLENPPPGNMQGLPTDVDVQQQGCTYVPHIVLLPPGGAMRFLNSDPIAHQVRLVGTETAQNAIQTKNAVLTRRFSTPGEYAVRCDLHPWMSAWAVVMKHRYYAVTDEDGRFKLSVPPGQYTLRVWHEVFGTLHGSANTGSPASFTFVPAAPEPPPRPAKEIAAASTAPEHAPPTLTRKLQSIQQLRDQGVLSPEEYRRIVDLLIAGSQ